MYAQGRRLSKIRPSCTLMGETILTSRQCQAPIKALLAILVVLERVECDVHPGFGWAFCQTCCWWSLRGKKRFFLRLLAWFLVLSHANRHSTLLLMSRDRQLPHTVLITTAHQHITAHRTNDVHHCEPKTTGRLTRHSRLRGRTIPGSSLYPGPVQHRCILLRFMAE